MNREIWVMCRQMRSWHHVRCKYCGSKGPFQWCAVLCSVFYEEAYQRRRSMAPIQLERAHTRFTCDCGLALQWEAGHTDTFFWSRGGWGLILFKIFCYRNRRNMEKINVHSLLPRVQDFELVGIGWDLRGASQVIHTQKVVCIWNDVPEEATEIDSIFTFKGHLNRYMDRMGSEGSGPKADKWNKSSIPRCVVWTRWAEGNVSVLFWSVVLWLYGIGVL